MFSLYNSYSLLLNVYCILRISSIYQHIRQQCIILIISSFNMKLLTIILYTLYAERWIEFKTISVLKCNLITLKNQRNIKCNDPVSILFIKFIIFLFLKWRWISFFSSARLLLNWVNILSIIHKARCKVRF